MIQDVFIGPIQAAHFSVSCPRRWNCERDQMFRRRSSLASSPSSCSRSWCSGVTPTTSIRARTWRLANRSSKLALNVFRLVNAILKQAVRWQLLARNPADSVEPPRAKKFMPFTPTPEQLAGPGGG